VTVDGLRQRDDAGRDETGRDESGHEESGRDESGRDERWYLEDEREFLRRSLEDAEREHEAGDLSDDDHALLLARDSARLAEVEAELAALGEEPAGPSPETEADEDARTERARMPRWRLAGIVASCLLIAAGAVLLVTHFVSARQPGEASSGSVTLSQAQQIEQQLQQALDQNNKGNTQAALALYDKVLSEDPSNPAALAYAGYLQWNVGSAAHVPSLVRIGRSEIETSVRDSPTYYEAHLFYGLVLANQDHNDAAAVSQFNDFVADDPPAAEPTQVASLVRGAYQAAGDPLPSAFSGSASSSTPSSAP
jgi:tetratricopeptide (TPR) repeat protein